MSESRTSKSIKNANVALIFYFIGLILNFISRKVFIDHLGADVLGLNTIAVNLLSFLNLAELGIGSAVSYSLYKPLHKNDHSAMQEIITVQGFFYRKIAYIVIAASCVLMLFFPLIFEKSQLPLWYAYSTFGVLLASSLMSYIWNYKQILLTADQKQYKITINQQLLTFIKVALQIVSVIYFLRFAYISWLVLEFFFSVVKTYALARLVKKQYPWLEINLKEGRRLYAKHQTIINKTKQLFFHKIGGFVLSQTSPIIIYFFASLTLVTSYGNYMLVVSGVLALMGAIFNSISAGVGNLVAQGNQKRIIEVFWELFAFRFYVVGVASICLFYLTDFFISIWIGPESLLSKTSLLLIIAVFYINGLRGVVDSFIQAYGLFKDVWATITEACLNLSLSILLGYFYGIDGILLGVFISLFMIIHLWKPYFLYKEEFEQPFKYYIGRYILYITALTTTFFVTYRLLQIENTTFKLEFFFYNSMKVILVSSSLLAIIMITLLKEFRVFISRMFLVGYHKFVKN